MVCFTKLQRVEEPLRRVWNKKKYQAKSTSKRNLPMGVDSEYAFLGFYIISKPNQTANNFKVFLFLNFLEPLHLGLGLWEI